MELPDQKYMPKTEIFVYLKYVILHLRPMVYLPVNLRFFFAEVIRQHKESRSIKVEKEEEVGLVAAGM
jgi:hypothetical protein